MTTPQGWQPSIKDLEQLAEQAKQREGRILVAINAARAVAWTAKRVAEIRARYVDEARVVVSMIERLSA